MQRYANPNYHKSIAAAGIDQGWYRKTTPTVSGRDRARADREIVRAMDEAIAPKSVVTEEGLATAKKEGMRRRRVRAGKWAGAMLAVGLLAGAAVHKVNDIRETHALHTGLSDEDALKKYEAGDYDLDKVTVIKSKQDGVPDELARSLKAEGDIRTLSDIIEGQDGANTVDGVQVGEQFVVPNDQIDAQFEQQNDPAKK